MVGIVRSNSMSDADVKPNITNTREEAELRTWFEKEKAENRIVDIKVFPGIRQEASLVACIKDVLAINKDEASGQYQDITDEEI